MEFLSSISYLLSLALRGWLDFGGFWHLESVYLVSSGRKLSKFWVCIEAEINEYLQPSLLEPAATKFPVASREGNSDT